ncbi:hypothetical protein KQX54_014890 [Cotesia glomerata]|uniref:Uncharacterized protein n=1 Tax=Cotesia glomerata TaxID=32391 RepID=A0AAV7IRX3_COTGL|nr:hypothetical protein KQX54_014890 [Cotesia glomerata]
MVIPFRRPASPGSRDIKRKPQENHNHLNPLLTFAFASNLTRTEVKYQFGRNNRPQGGFDKREQVSHLRIPGSAELHGMIQKIDGESRREAGKLLGAVADENGAHVSHSCLLYTLCSRLFTCYYSLCTRTRIGVSGQRIKSESLIGNSRDSDNETAPDRDSALERIPDSGYSTI